MKRMLGLTDPTTLVGGAVAAVIGFFKWFSSRDSGKPSLLKRIFGTEPDSEGLKLGVDNLSQLVQTLQQTVDWLTQQVTGYQETITAKDATIAEQGERITVLEDLSVENHNRIVELESQLKALGAEPVQSPKPRKIKPKKEEPNV